LTKPQAVHPCQFGKQGLQFPASAEHAGLYISCTNAL
jgi:hypothetical protein